MGDPWRAWPKETIHVKLKEPEGGQEHIMRATGSSLTEKTSNQTSDIKELIEYFTSLSRK